MHVAAQKGKFLLKLGKVFAARDAERVIELLESLLPFSEVAVDFTDVHDLEYAAFPVLFNVLESLDGIRVTFRGLTEQQSRLLRYLGLPAVEFISMRPCAPVGV